jgi:hypothetical protein
MMREVTFGEWCDFSLANGPVTFTEPNPDTMEGWRMTGRKRVLVVRATGYQTGERSYLVNDAAKKGNRK